jgi:hypothetical protein
MKKQIISLLLLTSLSQADGFYLGYDFLKVNYEDSEVNKNQIYTELANPLTTEPVFMILQKDLTDIN